MTHAKTIAAIERRDGWNTEFEELLLLTKHRELPNENSVMPLVRWLHDAWRAIHEDGASPEVDALSINQLRFDLARALFTDLRQPPVFDHAVDPYALRDTYYALETRLLTEDNGTNQSGLGSLLSGLRHAAIDCEASSDGTMPRKIAFKASGVGYRDIDLIATFPPAEARAHLGRVEIAFAGKPQRPLARVPVAEVTGYRQVAHSIEALGPLHRFGRYGEGVSTFGNWFTADGHGRELLAAMVAGLVNRVKPDVANGMGGVSPQFALTQAGVEFVVAAPRLGAMFDHYNDIDKRTAFLADNDKRVPFDTRTGSILGRLDTGSSYAPAYVTRSNLVGVVAGQEYSRDELGYLLSLDIERQRAQTIMLEDNGWNEPPLLCFSEDEFDQTFGLMNASASGTCTYEFDEVKDKDIHLVWSLVESGEDDTVYALPGFHRVNNIGYTVTEKPWPHDNIEAVYMASMEDDHDHRMRM